MNKNGITRHCSDMTYPGHSRLTYYWLLVLASLAKCLPALQLVKLDIPGIVSLGTPTWLGCNFDLENDNLYSVKWYKNRTEFYRYLPSDKPPGQTYDLDGVHVDLEQSNGSHVYLKHTDFKTEGLYMCEISGDSPSFQTITAEKDLHVYQLPPGGPTIRGLSLVYQTGDYMNVTCSTNPSKPKAKLKWSINGKDVSEGFVSTLPERTEMGGHLKSSDISLYMALGPIHFPRGTLKLVCSAFMEQLDSSSSRELVIPDTSQYAPPKQQDHSTPGQKAPTITGVKERYSLGDYVDVNCTTFNSATPTKLKWKINEKDVRESDLIPYPTIIGRNGLETATLGLHLKLKKDHFRNLESRFLCVATTYGIVILRSEETVVGFSELNSDLHVSEVSSSMENQLNSDIAWTANYLTVTFLFCLLIG